MNKNSIIDYLLYKLAVVSGNLFSRVNPEIYLGLGKFLGRMMFYLDKKHRNIVERNLRFVFCRNKAPSEIRRIAVCAFENFGQNICEAVALKRVDKQYIDKYVTIEGQHLIDEALENKKGLIYVTLHLGDWEIANAACGIYHKSCSVVIKDQKHGRLNELLNSYRKRSGVNLVPLGSLREIIRSLDNNHIVTMVSDHGAGKGDTLVDFFGRPASMPTGAVRLALKFKVPIFFAYIVRTHGPYHKIVIEKFDSFSDTRDKDKDLEKNLNTINKKFEHYISQYPQQYLWSYKRWKHSKERSVMILSDGKTGHLRQSETVAKIISGMGFNLDIRIVEIKYRNRFLAGILYLICCLKKNREINGWFLKSALDAFSYEAIAHNFCDIVISAGESIAWLNLAISSLNQAKSIHIMRPGLLGVKRFDLLVLPRHDRAANFKNIAVTEGALNLIDEDYLKTQAQKLYKNIGASFDSDLRIGLLIGGNTKDYELNPRIAQSIISRIKRVSVEFNANILITTSRRTPKEAEEVFKRELHGFDNCKLLIIANEKNIPEAVGGILGLSSLVIVTSESISMISEAASSGKQVIVVYSSEKKEAIQSSINKRHRMFLENLQNHGYIHLCEAHTLGYKIKEILTKRPLIKRLNDREEVRKKLKEIL